MFGAVCNPDHQECARIVRAALDQGINVVDTADMCSSGESEENVGKALKGRRDEVVLATKVHFHMGEGGPGEGRDRSGNSRRWIVRGVEDSLRRLDTDRGRGAGPPWPRRPSGAVPWRTGPRDGRPGRTSGAVYGRCFT